MEVAIIGGGIAGLATAINLKARGISATVYERVPVIREIGVGITILPHAMQEYAALGLQRELLAAGIENMESCFFNRFGQKIYGEQRGILAGYSHPEIGIHRGRLHLALLRRAEAVIGPDRIVTGRTFERLEQGGDGVLLHLSSTTDSDQIGPVHADIVLGCDGVNSAVRRQFYPKEELAFAGINTWRGVTRMKPILGGRTYIRIGSIRTGKIVVYPIANMDDGSGKQLVNWVAELQAVGSAMNDWNRRAVVDDLPQTYNSWRFDWLDVPAMLRNAGAIFEYPMVDRNPVNRWVFGRVALVGDAAHPMYPRGSNGSAQAVIDARTVAEKLSHSKPEDALRDYEAERLPICNRIVETNRTAPPDLINQRVEELVGDRPFDNLSDFISQDELRAMSDSYKAVANFLNTERQN
jgi:2-polyprenyl-6-methoxyphenol hydroxylase-like FAD-dependent oxidoreductase